MEAVYNVCEMKTPETLYLNSYIEVVETNCVSTLSTLVLKTIQMAACGHKRTR